MQSGWICLCSRRRKHRSVLGELETMSAQFSPRPAVIDNYPKEASDDGLRQVSRLGTYLLSALCKLYSRSLVCQSWGYLRAISFAATRSGYQSIQASTYDSRRRVKLLLSVEPQRRDRNSCFHVTDHARLQDALLQLNCPRGWLRGMDGMG